MIPTVVSLACALPGCGFGSTPLIPSDGLEDGNRDASLSSPAGKTRGEPNDRFEQAIVAVFDGTSTARLQGTVSQVGDLDVFLLGPLSRGDRLIVDAITTGSPLDVTVAVFDDQQRLVYNNDDRGGSPERFLDSYVDWVVRHTGTSCYLVVSHSPFAADGTLTGSYWVDVRIRHGFAVPPPTGQMFLLNFEGGVVEIPALGVFTLEPFEAERISSVYEGQTQVMKDAIRDVFVQNFERFNVTVVTTDDPPPTEGMKLSTLHFGGFDRRAFGASGGVDLYNADFCDDGIVFAETFDPRFFSRTPTAVEMATAIANVGAHEAGHLLGLNHTDDDLDLMDDQSAADALAEDQEFMQAPLSSDVMPIGTQDGVLLLMEIVGARPGP